MGAAEGLPRRIPQVIHRGLIAHVGHDGEHARAQRLQPGSGNAHRLFFDVGQHDVHAFAPEALREGEPHTARTPRNDGDSCFQISHIFSLGQQRVRRVERPGVLAWEFHR